MFLHDRHLISPWIKLIYNKLDIIIHVIISKLSGHCDIISYRMWHHQQNKNRESETQEQCVNLSFLSSFTDLLCWLRNEIMYVLSWWTVSLFTQVLFWYLFPSLLCNEGNKYQNNPLVSAETVNHRSTYIILSMYIEFMRWSFNLHCVLNLLSFLPFKIYLAFNKRYPTVVVTFCDV